MKAKIQIPRGWRKLRNKEIVRDGDRFLEDDEWWNSYDAGIVYGIGWSKDWIFIRRVSKRKAGK